MNLTAIARFITYTAAVGLGLFMTVWGVVHDDAALVTSGLALVTTNGLAATNTKLRDAPPVAAG